MRGQRGTRPVPGRLLLAVALGALALLAIPAAGFADHGHHHGNSDPAGTVKSFDQETGVLTIDLAEGGDIEGLVTDRTRIRCQNDNGREDRRHNRRHGGRATASDEGPGHDGSGGDNSGSGNSGDDHHAEEPGEDNHAEGDEPGEDNHDQGDEPGEENHGQSGEDDNEHHARDERCVGQLVTGATVLRAELELEDGQAVFQKVTLAG
jgi:hypothetical protein